MTVLSRRENGSDMEIVGDDPEVVLPEKRPGNGLGGCSDVDED